jgi:hypothetical protein
LISAGRLRFLATAKREENLDNIGKKQKDFSSTVGTFRCDLRDTSSVEIEYASGAATSNSFDCMARWDAIQAIGLQAQDKLLIQGRTFNIIGIRNEGLRNRLATITVEEII